MKHVSLMIQVFFLCSCNAVWNKPQVQLRNPCTGGIDSSRYNHGNCGSWKMDHRNLIDN